MPALGVILGCRSTKGRLFLPSIPLHRGVLKGLSSGGSGTVVLLAGMFSLKDLAEKISIKLQESWLEGIETYIRKENNSKTSGYHDSRKELDALMGLLNTKGERERGLLKQLAKFYCRICLGLQERSKDMIDKVALEETVLGTSTHVRATPREKPRKCLPPVH
ncbi:hypothetical protein MLD38_016273 [Melastoma candidum]|uniref:Uncharacterized protein n=1 Tax=Melastoma candidum TaxID=119954 RepID=A0ACB9RK29_9MYRT|nr:hypothetical protein MLD38_016273 [Melastoma candidum]